MEQLNKSNGAKLQEQLRTQLNHIQKQTNICATSSKALTEEISFQKRKKVTEEIWRTRYSKELIMKTSLLNPPGWIGIMQPRPKYLTTSIY